MIHVIVCDDDIRYARSIGSEISRIIHRNGYESSLSTFDSGAKLIDAINFGQLMDILFLDYEMPGLKGSDVAALLRKRDSTFKLVFISSHKQRAFTLFDYDMSSFVPKEIATELLESAVLRALKQLLWERENFECFTLFHDKSGKEFIRLHEKDIIYFDTIKKNVTLHTNMDGQSFSLGRLSIDVLEEKYSQGQFFRIDRATLVNLMYVTSYGQNYDHVKLKDGCTLYMSKGRKNAFLDKYLPLIHGK